MAAFTSQQPVTPPFNIHPHRNSFAQAADIDPEFAEAWYNKGIALMTLEKYLEAIRAFDKAIAINSNDREARQQRDLALKEDHGVL